MQKPTVLVLGATGRIGGILRKFWSKSGSLNGTEGGPKGRVFWQARQNQPADTGAGWTVLDPLSQPGALARAASGCSAILCLAGVVPGRLGPGGDLGDNIALGEAAVRAGAASGATVFLASSAAVYHSQVGNKAAGNSAKVLEENAALSPISDYGKAKAGMEARGAALGSELGVRVCALRIGNIAGVDAILGGWKPGFRLDQFPDGRTPRRSYIGMVTLAQVLGELMRIENPPHGLPAALNIACPGMVEMGALLDAAGLAWTPRPAPQEAIKEVCLSTALLERFITLPETSPDALVAQWRTMSA